MPDTYLSQAVDATNDADAAYDANAKYLLADKQILARILKYAVSEFQNMEIPAIISCISDNIEVGVTIHSRFTLDKLTRYEAVNSNIRRLI